MWRNALKSRVFARRDWGGSGNNNMGEVVNKTLEELPTTSVGRQ